MSAAFTISNSHVVRRALRVLPLFLLMSCGGDDGGTGPGDNRPPVIDRGRQIVLTTSTVLKAGDVVGFDVRALDPDIQPVLYSWSLEPSTDTGSFSDPTVRDPSWTVGSFRGSVTVTCVASDGELANSFSRTFEVGTEIEATEITGNVTWTRAGSPYVITGNVTVSETGALTVEPGVRLYSRPRQALVGGSSTYVRWTIQVLGTLDFGSDAGSADVTLLTGGILPATLPDAHDGITFFGSGSGTLARARIERARSAVQHGSSGIVELEGTLLRDNSVNALLVSAVGNGRLEMRDCDLQDNAVGITHTLGTVSLERVDFDGHLTALVVASTLEAIDCDLRASASTHLNLRRLLGSPSAFAVNIARSNFFLTEDASAVKIEANTCASLLLDLRGNYWGGSFTADQVLDRFAGRDDCNADVSSWIDLDCGDGSCDWSTEAFDR